MYEATEPVYIFDAVANKNYYLLKNDQNTVLAIYDSTLPPGTLPDEQYEYSSYGITTIQDSLGVVKNQVKSDFSNPFGYQGMWRDEHTGLYHTHYRLYDPQHVRWLTPDPAGYRDGQNLYRFYAGPNGVDVLGLSEIELHQAMAKLAIEKAFPNWFEIVATGALPLSYYIKKGAQSGVKSVDLPEGKITFLKVFTHPNLYSNLKPGEKGYETYQTHFGSNQFMHFMADSSSSPESVKKKAIEAIMELRKQSLDKLHEFNKDAKIGDYNTLYGSGKQDYGELVESYFYIGRIMHLIQDSFAEGHTIRNKEGEIILIQDYSQQYHGGLIEQLLAGNQHAQHDLIIPQKALEYSTKLLKLIDNEKQFRDWLENEVFKLSKDVKIGVDPEYGEKMNRLRDKAARFLQDLPEGLTSPDLFIVAPMDDLWTK